MATNWEDRDRYRRAQDDYESRFRGRDDRDWADRPRDETRSWFGDDEAEGRRRFDDWSDRYYGRGSEGSYRPFEGGFGRSYERDYGRAASGQYGTDRTHGEDFGMYGRSAGYGSGGYGGSGSRARSSGGYGGGGRAYGSGSYFGGRTFGEDFGPGGRAGALGRTGYGYTRDYDYGRSGRHGSEERGFFERAGDEIASWFGDEEAERRRRMDHIGRGPKGYTRSDERIREDVNDRLTDDPHIDASEIEVSVSSGEVTLSGTVTERFGKRHAEDLAERVSGVRHVQNNIRVKEWSGSGGSEYTGPYADVARATVESSKAAKTTRS